MRPRFRQLSMLFVVGVFSINLHVPDSVFAAESASIAEGKVLFTNFKKYGETFDAKLADLYSDDSVIQNTRFYPNGTARTVNFYGPIYKKMILEALPKAKAKGDIDTYSKETYKMVGDKIQVTAFRHAKLKNYDSWLVLLLAKRGAQLKIVEEHSQSRP